MVNLYRLTNLVELLWTRSHYRAGIDAGDYLGACLIHINWGCNIRLANGSTSLESTYNVALVQAVVTDTTSHWLSYLATGAWTSCHSENRDRLFYLVRYFLTPYLCLELRFNLVIALNLPFLMRQVVHVVYLLFYCSCVHLGNVFGLSQEEVFHFLFLLPNLILRIVNSIQSLCVEGL